MSQGEDSEGLDLDMDLALILVRVDSGRCCSLDSAFYSMASALQHPLGTSISGTWSVCLTFIAPLSTSRPPDLPSRYCRPFRIEDTLLSCFAL